MRRLRTNSKTNGTDKNRLKGDQIILKKMTQDLI